MPKALGKKSEALNEGMHHCNSDFGSLTVMLVSELFLEPIQVTNDGRRCKHKSLLGYLVKL